MQDYDAPSPALPGKRTGLEVDSKFEGVVDPESLVLGEAGPRRKGRGVEAELNARLPAREEELLFPGVELELLQPGARRAAEQHGRGRVARRVLARDVQATAEPEAAPVERAGQEHPELTLEELAAADLIGDLEAKARRALDRRSRILGGPEREEAGLRARGLGREEGVQVPAKVDLGGSISSRRDALAAELSAAGVLAKAGRVMGREAGRTAHSAGGLEIEVPQTVGAAGQSASRTKET